MGYKMTLWEFGTAAKASHVEVHSAPLTVGNIATQTTDKDAFKAAVLAVSLGNLGSEQFVAQETDVARNPASDEHAQRENKWLVSYVDNVTGRGGNFTIPCYDATLLGDDGSFMDTSLSVYTDLEAAVNAFVKSIAGNAVTLTSVKFTSRNLG